MISTFIAAFFAGAFLCNGVPHWVSGLQGRPFPSPFAKPPGRGDSSPVVNVLWGYLNLLVGVLLLGWRPFLISLNPALFLFALGVLVMGLQLASHFGKVQAAKGGR